MAIRHRSSPCPFLELCYAQIIVESAGKYKRIIRTDRHKFNSDVNLPDEEICFKQGLAMFVGLMYICARFNTTKYKDANIFF